jgi:hypothetical protein
MWVLPHVAERRHCKTVALGSNLCMSLRDRIMVVQEAHILTVQVQFLVPQWRAVQWSGRTADFGEIVGSNPALPIGCVA